MNEFEELPVVFLSIFEHNSNLLPWRETGAKIEMIPMTDHGDFDYEYLENKLKEYVSDNKKRLMIGAFSAGSNITGTLFDTDRLSIICH